MSSRNYKYTKVYEHYRQLIEEGVLKPGDKLPSLLACSKEHMVSKITVENAYFGLAADGYIISKEKSGFYVSNRTYGASSKVYDSTSVAPVSDNAQNATYDLSRIGDDPSSFRFDLWQRYVKSAIRNKERMATFGYPMGERELQEAICDYVRKHRNIYCAPENIIIGAGTQSLLMILFAILKGEGYKTASVPAKGFERYEKIIELQGFKVGIRRKEADIIYVSPSQMTVWGEVMPLKRRYEILEHSRNGHLIIEDDYQNEFIFTKQVSPSIYSLAGGDNVVYMGSFSKLLLPSIRISYMILPRNMASRWREAMTLYDQTASKSEQMALCSYLRDEHIYRQTKKLRKLYQIKRQLLTDVLRALIKGKTDLELLKGEGGMEMAIRGSSDSIASLDSELMKRGIKAISMENGIRLFSCSVISVEELQRLKADIN